MKNPDPLGAHQSAHAEIAALSHRDSAITSALRFGAYV
jgi:hypothetical protein